MKPCFLAFEFISITMKTMGGGGGGGGGRSCIVAECLTRD